jgi:DNA-binding LacI/PurR family transcriptional regulator
VQPIALGRTVMADITIYTLAKELNMTPSMISRAFNPNAKISEEKRKLILKTADMYGFSPNKFASRLSMKTVRIAIIINTRFKVNLDKMLKGINDAYENLKDYKIKYDVRELNAFKTSAQEFESVVMEYKDYDGIIISGASSKSFAPVINTLSKINPNVVQVQAINQECEYLFASKHNEETASRTAAEFLYNCLRNSNTKNILLFLGGHDSALHIRAKQFFVNACKDLGLNLLSSIDMNDDNQYLEEITPSIFEKFTKVDGIYVTSGVSTALCEYIESHNLNCTLVTFDVHNDVKNYMYKGIISATIFQNVSKQMEVAFDKLVKYIITGEQIPKTVFTDVQLVLRSNIHQYE